MLSRRLELQLDAKRVFDQLARLVLDQRTVERRTAQTDGAAATVAAHHHRSVEPKVKQLFTFSTK